MNTDRARIGFIFSRDLGRRIVRWVNSLDKGGFEIVGACCLEADKGFLKDEGIPFYEFDDLLDKQLTTCFSINYWRVIPPKDLRKVKNGIINIHHSYRLRYRGRNTCSWAIIHSRKDHCYEHGSSLHYIDERLDNGGIITTSPCPILPNDTGESLFRRVEELGFQLFKENFKKMISGPIKDFVPPSGVYYTYSRHDCADKRVDLDWAPEEIYDFVRAWTFTGKPKPYILVGERQIFLEFSKEED